MTAGVGREGPAVSDSTLASRAGAGDDGAFEEIVRRYQGFVYRQALSYLRSGEEARDAAQEVFLSAWEGIGYLRKGAALRPWLYRICRNRCLNLLRRRRVERKAEADPGPAGAPDMPLRVLLRERISELKEPYREALVLRYYQGLSCGEVADLLGISPGNARTRIYRARKMLRGMLEENDDGMR